MIGEVSGNRVLGGPKKELAVMPKAVIGLINETSVLKED
jgi:hypothetical protein